MGRVHDRVRPFYLCDTPEASISVPLEEEVGKDGGAVLRGGVLSSLAFPLLAPLGSPGSAGVCPPEGQGEAGRMPVLLPIAAQGVSWAFLHSQI